MISERVLSLEFRSRIVNWELQLLVESHQVKSMVVY